jgi:hypothetical protein
VSCDSKFSVGEIKLRRDWIEREEAAKWREREREFCSAHTKVTETHTIWRKQATWLESATAKLATPKLRLFWTSNFAFGWCHKMGMGSGVCVRRGADGNGSATNEFSPSPIKNTYVIRFPRWFSPRCQWGYFALRSCLGGINGGLWVPLWFFFNSSTLTVVAL